MIKITLADIRKIRPSWKVAECKEALKAIKSSREIRERMKRACLEHLACEELDEDSDLL